MAITSSNRKISFLCSFLPHLERMSQTVRVIASTQPSNEKEGHIEIVHIRVTDTELCIPLPCNTERKTFTSPQERDCIVLFILFYFIFVLFKTQENIYPSLYFSKYFFFFFLSPLNQFSTLQTLWSIWLWDPDSTNDQCDCQVESFLFFISTLNYAWSHHWNLSAWYLSSFFFSFT